MKKSEREKTALTAHKKALGTVHKSRLDALFFKRLALTGDITHAANYAYAKSKIKKHRNPLKYAQRVLKDSNYVRTLIEYHCNMVGLTDQFIVEDLAQGIVAQNWKNPEQAKIRIKLIDMLLKLKGRYPKEGSTFNIKTENADFRSINFLDRAKEELSDEEILRLMNGVSDTLSTEAVPVADQDDLFTIQEAE